MNTVAPQDQPSQGKTALERLLNRINLDEAFPSISKYVVELNKKLEANPETTNATDLSNIIINDHGLTSKLLKMVNSAYYGLAGGKVSTITRAVVLLGYENVRLAALSLTLFEHFKGSAYAGDLQETVVGAFWSGMMARQLANTMSGVDAEEAFLSAMMSYLGKMVMIHYLPRDYRKISTRIIDDEISETRAVKAVCGVTYEELGQAVAKRWHFPAQIYEAMAPLSKTALKNKKQPPEKLKIITGFVRAMHGVISNAPEIDDSELLQPLLKSYAPHISISKKQLKTMIEDSLENVRDHAEALSLHVSQSDFLGRLAVVYDPNKQKWVEDIVDRDKDPAADPAPSSYLLTDESQLKTNARIPDTRNPADILMEGIQELSQLMMTDSDVDTIAMMSLEIFYRALDFNRVLMFIRDHGKMRMQARFGCGDQSQRLMNQLGFEIKPSKDLFNFSLQVGKDLIVEDSHDEKMIYLIPSWYRDQIDAPSFVFLPIYFQKLNIGALYGDRETKGRPMSETEHRYVSMLRNQLVLSIKYTKKT